MIYKWTAAGRLVFDAECDTYGARYVTRASVHAAQSYRTSGRRPRVLVTEFLALTAFTEADVDALVKARLLVRVRPDGLTPESVRSWAAGHRPALLADPLLHRASA